MAAPLLHVTTHPPRARHREGIARSANAIDEDGEVGDGRRVEARETAGVGDGSGAGERAVKAHQRAREAGEGDVLTGGGGAGDAHLVQEAGQGHPHLLVGATAHDHVAHIGRGHERGDGGSDALRDPAGGGVEG